MKKYLLITLGCFISLSIVKAQDRNEQHSEKIQALKIAFITQKLQLSPAEAEKFWPVYNQYENEIKELHAGNKSRDALDNEQKLLDIKKKYKPSFEKILGPQKLIDLFNAERDFRRVLIKKLKDQRQQREE
ncbi:MAG: hypothetical protein ABI237_09475 [Ginsengibacter sp.]